MIRPVPLLSASLVLLACAGATRPAEGPIEVRQAAPYPDDEPLMAAGGDACARAARRLWECGCRESSGGDGHTFAAFCRAHGAAVATDCIESVHPCSELPARCHVRCLPVDAGVGG